jgi:hypothetical protein
MKLPKHAAAIGNSILRSHVSIMSRPPALAKVQQKPGQPEFFAKNSGCLRFSQKTLAVLIFCEKFGQPEFFSR